MWSVLVVVGGGAREVLLVVLLVHVLASRQSPYRLDGVGYDTPM